MLTIGPRTIGYISRRGSPGNVGRRLLWSRSRFDHIPDWSTTVVTRKPVQRPKHLQVGSALRRKLLLNTHVAGVLWREQWYFQLAADATRLNWSMAEVKAAVADDVEAVKAAKELSPVTASNLVGEGWLAGHPDVRGELHRLAAIRNELRVTERDLISQTLRRAAHVFTQLMRLQRDPRRRHHAASLSAYSKYLKRSRNRKTSKASTIAQPSVLPPPALPSAPAGHPSLHRARTPRIALTYQVDVATHEALRLESFKTRVPIQGLIDSAVRRWLQDQEV